MGKVTAAKPMGRPSTWETVHSFRESLNDTEEPPCYAEWKLAAAVLVMAIEDIDAMRNWSLEKFREKRNKWDFEQLVQWFRSDTRTWEYSFVNICDILQLDVGAIRKRVFPASPRAATSAVRQVRRHLRWLGQAPGPPRGASSRRRLTVVKS